MVDPPNITTSPASQTIPYNQTATLSVAATGTALKYQWFQVSGSGPDSPVGTDAPTYTTPALTADAQYYVRVSNAGPTVRTSAVATISVLEPPSLVVTILADVADNRDRQTSLREALAYAQTLGGQQTITFAPALAGQTVTVVNGWNGEGDNTALRTNTDVTIDGGAGVTINLNSATERRLFGCTGGALTLRNLTLSGGDIRGIDSGGALWSNATVNITNVRFTNNRGIHGGAIVNFGTMTISGSSFDNNATAANGHGGAIWSNNTLGVSGTLFFQNTAGQLGGAIISFNGLTVTDSTFSTNTSDFNGGALRLDGSAVISGSTFTNNGAVNGGGALISHGQTTITNSTIGYNGALDGGGAQFFEGTANIRHLTFAYNAAFRSGGGVVVNSANVTMTNTIVAANSAPDQNNLWGGPLNAASSNNLINTDPAQLRFGTFGNNGGPTSTLEVQPGSSAIDAGVAIDGITIDQRGTARPQAAAVDIGAFELVPSVAAATPVVGPLGGTYQSSVQVSISTSSPSATVRYTLDGTTPTTTNGTTYTDPFTLTTSATVRAIAVGGGWLESPVGSATYFILNPLPFWQALQGLPEDGSQDFATPAGDGVANILKFAFNMAPNAGDLFLPNVSVLPENGSAGLPFITRDAQNRLYIEFVGRKATTSPGIRYVVETSDDLTTWQTLDLNSASVVSIDSTWERVIVTDPVITPQRFGRVRVEVFGRFDNNFNAGLGAESLRGSAVWEGATVRLTEAVGGQVGAMVLDGFTPSPAINGFTARFQLAMGPTTSAPGDGASFAVGNLGTGAWGESGPGTADSLAVSFDTYDNGGNAGIGIHVLVNGTHLATAPINPYTSGASVPVEIIYDASLGLTVRYNNALVFDRLAVPGFQFPVSTRFGFGARTGGANHRTTVDDVEITTR